MDAVSSIWMKAPDYRNVRLVLIEDIELGFSDSSPISSLLDHFLSLSLQSVDQKKLNKVDTKLKQKLEKRAQKETSCASASRE